MLFFMTMSQSEGGNFCEPAGITYRLQQLHACIYVTHIRIKLQSHDNLFIHLPSFDSKVTIQTLIDRLYLCMSIGNLSVNVCYQLYCQCNQTLFTLTFHLFFSLITLHQTG